MILGFKKQFVQPILLGDKKHTIRLDAKKRWKAGRSIQMATGVRTKNYNCFKEDVCKSVQEIEIKYSSYPSGEKYVQVFVDQEPLNQLQTVILAQYDGFEGLDDFFTWFNKDFKGRLIHWTDLTY